ncbi:MAG: hypothetical protein N2D54_09875, partial [Chloroflexota bacterium]
TWYQVLQPEILNIWDNTGIILLFLIVASSVTIYIYFSRFQKSENNAKEDSNWEKQAFLIGLSAVLMGPIPAWAVGQQIMIRNPLWSSRLGLASIFGASLVIIALLESLIANGKFRTIFFSILIALSINWHINNTNDFRWAWSKQSRFYQQLVWRAPYIKPGTAIISEDNELFPFMGYYPTSFALNTLYPQSKTSQSLPYWFFGLNKHFENNLHNLLDNQTISGSKLSGNFFGKPFNSIIISFEPEKNQCLWVLRPEDSSLRILPGITREAVQISNPSQILPDSPSGHQWPEMFLGDAPEKTWCYSYQKADLARQFEDWGTIRNLWQTAEKNNLRPKNGFEFLPFVEAYGLNKNWDTAYDLTRQANRLTPGMAPILCHTWKKVLENTNDSDARAQVYSEVNDLFDCTNN